jgi:hypothetical protein
VTPLSAQPKYPDRALNQYASTDARGPAPSSPGSKVPAKGELGSRLAPMGRNMATFGCEMDGYGSHLSGTYANPLA